MSCSLVSEKSWCYTEWHFEGFLVRCSVFEVCDGVPLSSFSLFHQSDSHLGQCWGSQYSQCWPGDYAVDPYCCWPANPRYQSAGCCRLAAVSLTREKIHIVVADFFPSAATSGFLSFCKWCITLSLKRFSKATAVTWFHSSGIDSGPQ